MQGKAQDFVRLLRRLHLPQGQPQPARKRRDHVDGLLPERVVRGHTVCKRQELPQPRQLDAPQHHADRRQQRRCTGCATTPAKPEARMFCRSLRLHRRRRQNIREPTRRRVIVVALGAALRVEKSKARADAEPALSEVVRDGAGSRRHGSRQIFRSRNRRTHFGYREKWRLA